MDRKLIAVAVSSALALPMAAQAVEFAVSGHINRAIVSLDGAGSDGSLTHVDANSSETRFRFTGSEETAGGLTAGVNLELGRPGNWRTRHANVSLTSAGGKVTIGQGSEATDGVAHARLGGPSWLAGVTNWCSYGAWGAYGACKSNDGNRNPVLRYDTPAIGAAKISASLGNNDFWDAKLSVAGSMGDSGYDVRVGYKDDSETTVASAAFSMGQGTSVAIAWSQSDAGGASYADEYQYAEVDHSYGDGSVGVYYKRANEGDVDSSLWGIGVGHSLGAGATVYAGYRNMDGDDVGGTDLFVAGMRVTFN